MHPVDVNHRVPYIVLQGVIELWAKMWLLLHPRLTHAVNRRRTPGQDFMVLGQDFTVQREAQPPNVSMFAACMRTVYTCGFM
jgi:hypothetical protein